MTALSIFQRRFPDKFLTVPNTEYFFGDYRDGENLLDVVEIFKLDGIAEIYLLRIGALAFHFLDDGDLRSIEQLKTTGSGEVPVQVLDNEEEIIELQRRRLQFANFIAAGLFGRLMALSRMSLRGAQYAAMDNILAFGFQQNGFVLEKSSHTQAVLAQKIEAARENKNRNNIVRLDYLKIAINFMSKLAAQSKEFTQADLQLCLSMNYQAAILHERQHSEASLALNFSVVEVLINEIFYSYGLIDGFDSRAWASRPHSVSKVSPTTFRKLVLAKKVEALSQGGLIDQHLLEKLKQARILRNNLMHRGVSIGIRQSGQMQTTARDLWQYFLNEPFELMAPFSMRV